MNIPIGIISLLIIGSYGLFAILLVFFLFTSLSPLRRIGQICRSLFYRDHFHFYDFHIGKHDVMMDWSRMFVGAILISCVYSLGIIFEHLSDSYKAQTKKLFFMEYSLVESDDRVLASAFTRVFKNRSDVSYFVDEIETAKKLDQCLDNTQPRRVIFGLLHEHTLEGDCKAHLNRAKGHYYDHKNIVFKENNYFSDLSFVVSKLEFTRALAFVSGILTYAMFFGVVLCGLRLLLRVKSLRKLLLLVFPGNRSLLRHYIKLKSGNVLTLFTVAVMVWVLVVIAWRGEQTQFYLKTYGYYSGLVMYQQEKQNKSEAVVLGN